MKGVCLTTNDCCAYSYPFYHCKIVTMNLLSSVQVKRYQSYVGIRIAPDTSIEARPFHIAFLLDVSGSMQGERLDTVKRTLHLFADQMRSEDRVSLITYNASARIVCPAGTKQEMLEQVDRLEANGGTNMEAGILALKSLDLTTVDAVFLLTDGEVNQGISSVRGLEGLARLVAFGSHKIPMYTLGYGADHNAKLLQAIAIATRASYTFAEAHEMIPSVVGSILVAMRDEVAKGVTVTWEGEARCWEAGAESTNSFCVGSIIANKPQWIVLKGVPDSLTLSASNMAPESLSVPTEEEDLDVLEQWFRAESVRVFTEIAEMGPMGALPRLQTLEDAIVASPVAEYPLLLRLRAEIGEQRALLDQMAAMPAIPAAMPPGPPFLMRGGGVSSQALMGGTGSFINGGMQAPALSRFVSNVTAYATQRGEMPEFNSPTQRQVSGAMVRNFYTGASNHSDPGSFPNSQHSNEDPVIENENTAP